MEAALVADAGGDDEDPPEAKRVDGIRVINLHDQRGARVGRRWKFRVWDGASRKWKSQSFESKRVGWRWALDKRAQFARGEAVAGRVPFAVVAQDYVDRLLEQGRNERYRSEVDRVAKAVVAAGATDLTSDDFERKVRAWLKDAPSFADGRTTAPGPGTKNRWLIELRSICKHAVHHYGLRLNPLRALKPFKVDDTLVATLRLAELRAMVADRMADHPYYLVACLMVYAGLRVGEALHLRREWIDRDARTIQVKVIRDAKGRVVFAPKRNRERIVPLPRELESILVARVPEIDRPGWLIEDPAMRALHDTREHWELFRAYIDRAVGAEGHAAARDLHPHCCRHTYTAVMLATGVDQMSVKRSLGHSSLTTTDGYADAVASFATAVRGWPRGELALRPGRAGTPGEVPADPLAAVRAALAGGRSVAELAAAAGVDAAVLTTWLRGELPEPVRAYLALLAVAAR